jgi:hypothetical protein
LVSGANQSITPKSNVPISQQQGTNDSNAMEIESDFSTESMDPISVDVSDNKKLELLKEIDETIVETKNDLKDLIPKAIELCQRAKIIYERHDPNHKFLATFLASQNKDFNLKCEFSLIPNGSESIQRKFKEAGSGQSYFLFLLGSMEHDQNKELKDEVVRIGKLTEFYLKIAYHVMDQ